MSKEGLPEISVTGKGRKVAVIAAHWYGKVTDALTERASQTLEEAGAEVTVVRVPGTFELPVACARLADKFDAMIALGVVVRGGTPHFDYVCEGATQGLIQVMVDTGKPIGFGVLTCNTEQEAIDRSGLPGSAEDKGREAAEAVLATLEAIESV
ncbi:6,7-dimethyl-8-ribityllumazine synthase [Propionimicrobium lymphophilum]|uniref:6,7-dimethyl-8-ribityllumazine synthase n=1 Tax=Propionimicrobium lymphophilum TaxID=33012 RepID=UPI00254B7EAF|nr:6,7-dimethyl-8-ribityllumazine synthase [Propionimicrobium lymphophilum]MDK7709492.1 6,7-dimethyl-8-ribityllumazine synthase [Propionimicrobium lymphophilum]MDK7733478.1 6,7-dimethyl-8-ribityllumazine synthase [Propionimicrobium lymphophilum]